MFGQPMSVEALGTVEVASESALRGGGNGLISLLIFLLSSVPLTHLSKKASAVFTLLMTSLLAMVQRLRDRRALASESEHKQMAFEDANGTRHEVRVRCPPSHPTLRALFLPFGC